MMSCRSVCKTTYFLYSGARRVYVVESLCDSLQSILNNQLLTEQYFVSAANLGFLRVAL